MKKVRFNFTKKLMTMFLILSMVFSNFGYMLGNSNISYANEKEINYTIENKDNIKPGSKVLINFDGIEEPIKSVSGEVNVMRLHIEYDTDIPGVDTVASATKNLESIEVNIPKDIKAGSYTLSNGHVNAGWYGKPDPKDNYKAPFVEKDYYEGQLPEITLNVKDGSIEDTTKPEITTNLENKTVNKEELIFKVSANDDTDKNVAPVVKVNNKVLTEDEGNYKATLNEGKNDIVITATDIAGNEIQKSYTINYENKSKVKATYKVTPEHIYAGTEVTIKLNNVKLDGIDKIKYSTDIPSLSEIETKDVSEGIIQFTIPEKTKGGYYKLENGYTCEIIKVQGIFEKDKVIEQLKDLTIHVEYNGEDKTAPEIITDLENKTTNQSEFTFTVSANDDVDGKVTPNVTLNDIEKTGTNGSYSVDLKDGKNTIKITATDDKGNKSERIFIINYKEAVKVPGKVLDDFTNDLWLNTNFKILEVNDTYVLTSRRVPEIIDNPINNKVSHPPYSYKIIEGDSVKLQNTTDSNMTITAVKKGTSIIEVGYEKTTANGQNYGAVSDVNKAYMIVDVVDDKNVNNGINLDTDISMRSYDTIYYSKGDTVDYAFNVTATGSDNVEVTCNGNVVEGSGNKYTVKLENRSNIIGITATKGDAVKKLYYVIDARKIDINIENISRPNEDIAVGDEVKVSFEGITSPVYKLATIYNPTWYEPDGMWGPSYGTTVRYNNSDLGEVVTYDHDQYDLANHNAIKFTVTEEKTYKFTNGHINSEWWGSPLGTEKDMNGPGNPNLGAPTLHDDFSILPDFEITVGKSNIVPATGIEIQEKDITVDEGATIALSGKVLPEKATEKGIKWSSNDTNIATVDENGVVTGIKEGKATITAKSVDGNFTDTCEITVKKEIVKEGIEITKEHLNQNNYDVFYYVEGEDYTIEGKTVAFISDKQIQYGGNTGDLKNKKINYEITAGEDDKVSPGETVTIRFNELKTPIGAVSGQWNSGYGGTIQSVYDIDIDGVSEIRSENKKINTLTFKIPEGASGEYHLTNGRIYEQANEWSPGIEGIGTEGYFGVLPNISISVENNNKDTKAPQITTDLESKTVNEETLTFTASSNDDVDGKIIPVVKLNNEVVTENNGKYSVTLKEAENTILIEATDASGNKATKEIKVTYAKEVPTDKDNFNVKIRIEGYKGTHFDDSVEFNSNDYKGEDGKYRITEPSGNNLEFSKPTAMLATIVALNKENIKDNKIGSNYISRMAGEQEKDFSDNPTCGWMVRVNDVVINKGAGEWEIKDGDTIDWYYTDLASYFGYIDADSTLVKSGEKTKITVTGKTNDWKNKSKKVAIEGATVYVGDKTYVTDNNGEVEITMNEVGEFDIYALKVDKNSTNDGYNFPLLSKTKKIHVKVEDKVISGNGKVVVGQATGLVGSTIKLPVNVENLENLAGGKFEITFDPNYLKLNKVEKGEFIKEFNEAFNLENKENGKIIIGFANATGKEGSGKLLDLEFELKKISQEKVDVKISNAKFNNDTPEDVEVEVKNGSVNINEKIIYGDIDNDGEITTSDSTLILKNTVDLVEFNDEQKLAADVDGDGEITTSDATLILQRIVELINEFPVEK